MGGGLLMFDLKEYAMKRRDVLRTAAALTAAGLCLPALAHHGWSSFDQDRPLYLEGIVVKSVW